MSQDYFTNRQDRYVVISDCEELADLYFGLIERVSSVSLGLDKEDTLTPRSPQIHPYKSALSSYESEARQVVWDYYLSAVDKAQEAKTKQGTVKPLKFEFRKSKIMGYPNKYNTNSWSFIYFLLNIL